jgi:thiol-disulfide isomerase/thioredoxin
MLKLLSKLSLIIVLSLSLFGTENIKLNKTEKKVLKFGKRLIEKSIRRTKGKVTLKEVKIVYQKELKEYDGWKGYILALELKVPGQTIKDTLKLFSDGKLITMELFKLQNGMEISKTLFPPLTMQYYNENNLLQGNINAKHKIVVFSDPECPFCREFIPEIIKSTKKYPKDFALFYYPFPLERIHPSAKALTLLSMLAHKDGKKDVELKVYKEDFEDCVNYKLRKVDMNKLLLKFNKLFDTKYTQKDMDNKELNKELASEISMAEKVYVRGTPTVFFDGEYDNTRYKYEKFISKKNTKANNKSKN